MTTEKIEVDANLLRELVIACKRDYINMNPSGCNDCIYYDEECFILQEKLLPKDEEDDEDDKED